MADPEKEHPSLELPKLGWRRRRASAPPPADPPADSPDVRDSGTDVLADRREDVPVDTPPRPEPEPTRPVLVDAPLDRPTAVPAPAPPPASALEPPPAPARRARRERGPGGTLAAVVSGLVVGLGIVGLTWASLRSCEGVQGTSSCGGAGYPLLALILVIMVFVGALLLRLARVVDPGTTSFLGVGLAVVVALLVLVDHLLDRSMVLVVPAICAGAFALAHWVTSTFIEPARD
ncbi:hypothetical protein [Nocardioides sp.]|uniref:hypothetical protein n=1 Tax=Nocardioides sp. TaxID=35761 RepID=UPI003782E23C